MKVEKTNETAEEIRLHITVDAEQMSAAFTDGLDAFVLQYKIEEAEGETAKDKILGVLGEEDGQQAIYSAVINYLVPFALQELGILPLATYGIQSKQDPCSGEPFSFEMTVLPKPEFELSNYDPAIVWVGEPPKVAPEDVEAQVALLVREFEAEKQGKSSDDSSFDMPEITDQWVKENLAAASLSTLAELRGKVRDTSISELASRYEQEKMNAAMAAYTQRLEGEISKTMKAAMVQELYE